MKSGIIRILAGILTICFLNSTVSTAQTSKVVVLAGYKLKPSIPTAATGTVIVTVDRDSLFVEGSFSDLSTPYRAAGIYFESGTRASNRLLRLKAVLNEEKTGGKFHKPDNGFKLSPSLQKLMVNGELSVRITSNQYQHGEIGSTIPPMRAP